MKFKLLIATFLTSACSIACADTYVVAAKDSPSDAPKLAVAHGAGTCVYADRVVRLGDTIIIDGMDTVLVCAGAPQGAAFYPLSESGAQRVVAAVPAAKGAVESISSAYKITTAPAPAFTPVKVWDDGQFTFIQLAKPYRDEIPIVFALGEDGSRSVVNFQWDEKNARLVVSRVLERAILMQGNKSVVVSRS